MENELLTSNKINTQKIGLTFLKYVSMNIISTIAISLYILIDTMFIANTIGKDGVTAVNIVIPFFSLLNGTGAMLAIGGSTRFSIANGAGDKDIADRIFTEIILLVVGIGSIYMILGLAIPEQICRLLGADDQIVGLAASYMRGISIFSIPFMSIHILCAFTRNDNAPNLAMIAVVCGCLFNILFDWVVMGPCNANIFWASFITGFSAIIATGILSIRLILKKSNFTLVKPKMHWSDVGFVFATGFPSLINELASGLVATIYNILLYNLAGNNAINAYGVISNLSLVIAGFCNGIAQGTQPIFSYNYGAGNQKNINKTFLYGAISTMSVALISYLALYLGSDFFIGLFNKEGVEEIFVLGKEAITLHDFSFFGFAASTLIMSLYSSTGKQKYSFIMSLLRGLILPIPLAFGLSHLLGLTGIWITMPITETTTIIVGLIFLFFWFKGMKKKSNFNQLAD